MAKIPRTDYLRYRSLSRMRHSSRFKSWLSEQAERLGMSDEDLFEKMKDERMSATDVTNADPAVVNTTLPSITGTIASGSVLTADRGVWTGASTYVYDWLKDGLTTGIATTTYTLAAGDVGAMISVRVTGTDADGTTSVSAVSAEVGPITA